MKVARTFHSTTEHTPHQRRRMEADMKARHIILTIAVAVLLTAPTAVLAQGGPGPGQGGGNGGGWGGGFGPHGDGQGGGMLRMIPRILRHLDLEPGQQELIEEVLENAKEAIESLVDPSIEAREAFHQDHGIGDFNADTYDAYKAFYESLAAIDVEIKLVSADAMSQVWKLLSAEQQEQLQEMLEDFGRGMKRRAGGRRSP
jgi:Spy/CpxP family protein refolding chaperone